MMVGTLRYKITLIQKTTKSLCDLEVVRMCFVICWDDQKEAVFQLVAFSVSFLKYEKAAPAGSRHSESKFEESSRRMERRFSTETMTKILTGVMKILSRHESRISIHQSVYR